MKAQIEVRSDILLIRSPYNREFVAEIRGLGKWDKQERAWIVPVESAPHARRIVHRHYGDLHDAQKDLEERLIQLSPGKSLLELYEDY